MGRLPSLMSKLKEPLAKLEIGFEKAQEQKLSKDDAELWVLAHIAHATQTELDELVSSLKLDTREGTNKSSRLSVWIKTCNLGQESQLNS